MTTSIAFSAPALVQVAMASNNIPRSIEFYTKVFGFVDGRGEALWSPHLAKLQGLGEQTSTWIWWLVGRQEYLQLEFFQHSIPAQRPLPDDWRASDHGWVRWGMSVPNLDTVARKLAEFGVEAAHGPVDLGDGLKRLTFRDPFVGTWVEVIEDNPVLPLGVPAQHFGLEPAVVYATVSVPDLVVAREFWVETLGLPEVDRELLHPAAAEALWELDSLPQGFCVDAGGRLIEVVEYADGRPKADDYRLSDQGMINVAVGYRSHADLGVLVDRLADAGCALTADIGAPPTPAAGYTHAPDGTSVEILAAPAEYDVLLGFAPRLDNELKQRVHGTD